VTRVINKFKEERNYINQIRPIKHFILNGLIFDSLFTLRFCFTNAYYFIMVRFLQFFKQGGQLSKTINAVLKELELFRDLESETKEFFHRRPDIVALIVGHTHEADIKNYADGTTFINTGTWTKMFNLDFSKKQDGYKLTFAQIDVKEDLVQASTSTTQEESKSSKRKKHNLDISLNEWKGMNPFPYEEI
jgi:UDP-2,3-diacylglucosamine pyrophosphatase LpxH